MKKVILTLALAFTGLSTVANPASVVANTSFGIESEVLTLDPVFKRKGEKLLINLLNADQVMVEIKILDSQDNVIFTERVAGDLIVEKVFDFSKAYNDSYKIVVAYNQNAFEHIVKVQ